MRRCFVATLRHDCPMGPYIYEQSAMYCDRIHTKIRKRLPCLSSRAFCKVDWHPALLIITKVYLERCIRRLGKTAKITGCTDAFHIS